MSRQDRRGKDADDQMYQEPRRISDAKIRKAFGRPAKRIDRNFCLNYLWWWHPLLACLDSDFKKTGNYRVRPERRGFFPESVFETLQAHHDAGEMHSLLHLWRVGEIGERIEELSSDVMGISDWPAYRDPTSYYSSAISLRKAVLGPLEIDLALADKAIVALLLREVERLRTEADRADDRVRLAGASNRNRYFNTAAFSVIELMDGHLMFGDDKDDDKWANVRKAVKEAYR